MLERPINGGRAGGIVRHKDNTLKIPFFDHSVQIALLILGGVWIVSRFVRASPPEKIKCDNAAMR
jgi:hypothetical protein